MNSDLCCFLLIIVVILIILFYNTSIIEGLSLNNQNNTNDANKVDQNINENAIINDVVKKHLPYDKILENIFSSKRYIDNLDDPNKKFFPLGDSIFLNWVREYNKNLYIPAPDPIQYNDQWGELVKTNTTDNLSKNIKNDIIEAIKKQLNGGSISRLDGPETTLEQCLNNDNTSTKITSGDIIGSSNSRPISGSSHNNHNSSPSQSPSQSPSSSPDPVINNVNILLPSKRKKPDIIPLGLSKTIPDKLGYYR